MIMVRIHVLQGASLIRVNKAEEHPGGTFVAQRGRRSTAVQNNHSLFFRTALTLIRLPTTMRMIM